MFLLLVFYFNFIHHGNGVIFIVFKRCRDVIFYLKTITEKNLLCKFCLTLRSIK